MAVKVNGSRLAVLEEERLSRGIDLYLRGRIRLPYRGRGDGLKVGKTLFGVLSDSRPGLMHIVERPDEGSRWTCDCEDVAKRGGQLVCKHIRAVLYWLGQVTCPFCGRKVEGLYTTGGCGPGRDRRPLLAGSGPGGGPFRITETGGRG